MELLSDLASAENLLFARLGKNLKLATPLGLGKPNQLLNLIYQRVKTNPDVHLTLFTALSLDIPEPHSDLERRFVEPFYERHFGVNYPRLQYLKDLKVGESPENVTVHEFYFQAGTLLKNHKAQQSYVSLNYTHVAESIFELGINGIVQLIARSPDGKKYSLSCNPDLTLDVADLYKQRGRPLLIIGVVHPELPYLGGDAEVDGSFFDAVVESPEVHHKLFAIPKAPLTATDHMIGLHASRLIRDDGTLQIGIGSLSDAIVASTIFRQQNNGIYKSLIQKFDQKFAPPHAIDIYDGVFSTGLYGTSEMLMDGFMHLRRAGVLRRMILDHDELKKRYLHGAFFLGSKDFYQWLATLDEEDYKGLSMTRVSKVNDLYDEHELALRRQRKNARFFNTCMKVTLLGGAASETLEDGDVISGVGGQYNFVAMSHELPDSHSVLLLKSTYTKGPHRKSNIVWSAGQLTIPRHLRDVVVTEYGIANLKGQSDEECIKRLIVIADAEFQDELLATARKYGKISVGWEIPNSARENTPENLHQFVQTVQKQGTFARFPFGSDFSDHEQALQKALLSLKGQGAVSLVGTLIKGMGVSTEEFAAELRRMKLDVPESLKERVFQKLLLGALNS